MAVPCICRLFFPFNWKEFSAKISLSALCSSHEGIGGLFLGNALYAGLRNHGHHEVTNNSQQQQQQQALLPNRKRKKVKLYNMIY